MLSQPLQLICAVLLWAMDDRDNESALRKAVPHTSNESEMTRIS